MASEDTDITFDEALDLIVKFARSDGLDNDISLLVYKDKSVFKNPVATVLVHSANEENTSSILHCCKILQHIVEKGIRAHIKVESCSTETYNTKHETQRPLTTIISKYLYSHKQCITVSTVYDMLEYF